MDATYTRPKLRWPLDIPRHLIGSDEVLVIRCPLGVSSEPRCLEPKFGAILSLFDGARTSEEIVATFSAQGLTKDLLSECIKLLDERLLLSNPRFFAAEKIMREAFESAPVRPAALAGGAYPAQRESLEKVIDGYLSPTTGGDGEGSLLGLVAPHIYYARGGACYGAAYARLSRAEVDSYILIGTSHQYSRELFHLCAKDFESPLGVHRCDEPLIARLANLYGLKRSFAEQHLHRKEHSLELQLPFLSRVCPTARVAPILVGSFHRMIEAERYPEEWEEYESFASALTELVCARRAAGERIAFLAGVDMAHVGRAFGDTDSLTPHFMERIAARHQEYLAAIERGDKRALFDHIASDNDARRICGFPTMYLVLDVLARVGARWSGSLVRYDQAVDYQSDCAVTFAGMALLEIAGN